MQIGTQYKPFAQILERLPNVQDDLLYWSLFNGFPYKASMDTVKTYGSQQGLYRDFLLKSNVIILILDDLTH